MSTLNPKSKAAITRIQSVFTELLDPHIILRTGNTSNQRPDINITADQNEI